MGIIRNLIHDVVVPALQPTPQQAGAPPSEQAKVGATDVANEKGAYSAPPPPPPAPAARGRRGRRERRGLKDEVLGPLKGNQPDMGLGARYCNVCAMWGDAHRRRALIVDILNKVAFSLIVIGAIFLGLSASGNFMGSVEEMKYVGIYSITVAKYSLYVFTGIVGVAACVITRKALAAHKPLNLSLAMVALALASVIATVTLTCIALEKSVELDSPWWSYLLTAAMLIQRLFFFICACIAFYTLWEVAHDTTGQGRDDMMAHFPGHVPRAPAAGTTPADAADAVKPTDPPTGQWAV